MCRIFNGFLRLIPTKKLLKRLEIEDVKDMIMYLPLVPLYISLPFPLIPLIPLIHSPLPPLLFPLVNNSSINQTNSCGRTESETKEEDEADYNSSFICT